MRRRSAARLAAAAAVALVLAYPRWAQGAAPQHGCTAGCDLSAGAPVCGADELTYATECLAACQGVAVAAAGPCSDADARQLAAGPRGRLAATAAGRPVLVTREAMDRFRAEGFLYVGKGRADPGFQPGPAALVGSVDPAGVAAPPPSGAARYVFSTQDLYRTPPSGAALSAAFAPPAALSTGAPEGLGSVAPDGGARRRRLAGAGRRLRLIIGDDTRVRVPDTSLQLAPWSSIGLLQSQISGQFWRQCTGFMIAPGAAATAASCVHGGAGGGYSPRVVLTPAFHGKKRPFGFATAAYVTVYSGWYTNPLSSVAAYQNDLAVLNFEAAPGYETGWFNLALAADTFAEALLTTGGYPSDVEPAASMWTTSCSVFDASPLDRITATDCDSSQGQNGAPMWEIRDSGATRIVRGIVSFGASASGLNYNFQMTKAAAADAWSWATATSKMWLRGGARGRYCSDSARSSSVRCRGRKLTEDGKFSVTAIGNGTIALRSGRTGAYCTEGAGGAVACGAALPGAAGAFAAEFSPVDGTLALRGGLSGKYCSDVSAKAGVQCIKDAAGPSERFRFAAAL